MTENTDAQQVEKRKPGRPKGSGNKPKPPVDPVPVPPAAELDEEAKGRGAKPAEKHPAPAPVQQAPANAVGMTGKKVAAPSSDRPLDPAKVQTARPNALQQALGTQPIVYYMGGGTAQIKPTHTSVVQLNDGTYGRQTAQGFKLRRANKTQPFSPPFDPDLDRHLIEAIEAYRASPEGRAAHAKRGNELYPWDGGKLAPPMERWDELNADAIKRVVLAGAVDPLKCLKYEMQKPLKRQHIIDAIEEANAVLEQEQEAAKVEAEVSAAREQEASVSAVAI